MIAALANAGALLGEDEWVAMAERAFHFITREMTRGDRLGHSWREGRLVFPGIASDYAAMIRAALALHQATGQNIFLERATVWAAALERHHSDAEHGGYFLTADDAEGMIVRLSLTRDDAIPNPNALMAQNLVRLAFLAGDDRYRTRVDRLFDGIFPAAAANLFGHGALFNALDLRLRHQEVVVTGARADDFAATALRQSFLTRSLLRVKELGDLSAHHPAAAKLAAAPADGAAFVCVGETCSLPITESSQLAAALKG
jgi:uncharacterized protein YyaL (SSP411 family)